MQKVGVGYEKAVLTDGDRYFIPFVNQTSWQDRTLLLAMILFMDYTVFGRSFA